MTTTTEPCTTGVTNELGGCEPVGVTPTDLQPTIPGINGPAVVNLPQPSIGDECWLGSNPDTPIGDYIIYASNPDAPGTHSISGMPCGPIAETSIADPPQLPATGLEETLAIGAGVLLLSGILLARLARKEH